MARAKLEAEVRSLEALADRLRDSAACGMPTLHLGRGGEVSTLPDSRMPLDMLEVTQAVQARPTTLAAEAALDQLVLARDASALTLAVETAESIGANDAVQQMLAHELATAHRMAMRLMGSADTELRLHEHSRVVGGPSNAMADACRCAIAAARLMDSVSRTALALDRLRHGAWQHVVVQHVAVGDGGQAGGCRHHCARGWHSSAGSKNTQTG